MIQHFIITPFSYRNFYFTKKKGLDPLKPKRLEHRFRMFEIACLPGILNQENQNFTWILIVDPALPEKYRKRLETLISVRRGSYLLEFSEEINLAKLNWLKQWIKPQTKYIVTTTIGDDDALFDGFTTYVSNHINQLNDLSKLPPVLFFGAGNEVFWDFYWSNNAPLGYKKQRKMFAPSAAGFSVCCKYPEIDFSIFSFSHVSSQFLYNHKNKIAANAPVIKDQIAKETKLIKEAVKIPLLNWDGILTQENYHTISFDGLHTVILNHPDNIQFMRFFGNPWWREPVNTENSFEGVSLNFELAADYIKKYRKSWRLFFWLVIRQFIFFDDDYKGETAFNIFVKRIKGVRKIAWGVRNMN